jgi:hypothetical protein
MQNTIITLAVISLLASCKPATDSGLKTVDQFAGGSAAYQCKGEFKENSEYMKLVRGVKSDAQRRAVESALSAVPTELKDAIFLGAIDTSIELTTDISGKCESSVILKANAKTKSAIFACPVIENGAAKIYVDSNPMRIQSSLVRALAYYLVEIIGKIDIELSTSANVVVGFAKQDDVKQSKKLLGALEFLDDVATNRQGDLSIFGHLLPPSVTAAKDKVSRSEAFFDPARTNVRVREAFASYFLAEMLDSSFCSDQSRQVLITQFPKTFKFFAGSSPGELSLASESGVTDEAFSLAGSSTSSRPSAPASASQTRAGSSSQSGASNITAERVSVAQRTSADPIPPGLKDSGKKMYMVQSDGSEIPTTLYYGGNQQFWKSNDGVWRQSNVTTLQNGEHSVGKVLEAPPEWNPQPAVQKKPASKFVGDGGTLQAEAMPSMEQVIAQRDQLLKTRPPTSSKVEAVGPLVNGLTKVAIPGAQRQDRAAAYARQGEYRRQQAARNASGGSTSPTPSVAQRFDGSGSQKTSTFCRWLPFFCSSSGGSSSGGASGGW